MYGYAFDQFRFRVHPRLIENCEKWLEFWRGIDLLFTGQVITL